MVLTGSEHSKEHRLGSQSLHKSWSCMTLNRQDNGNGRRSRTDSVSSLRSCQSSSSTRFGQSSVSHSWGEQSFEDAPYSWDVQSSEDPLSSSYKLDSDFDVSSLHSQDEFYESSQDMVRSSTSSSQSNGMDDYVTASSTTPVESEDSDGKWAKLESNCAGTVLSSYTDQNVFCILNLLRNDAECYRAKLQALSISKDIKPCMGYRKPIV